VKRALAGSVAISLAACGAPEPSRSTWLVLTASTDVSASRGIDSNDGRARVEPPGAVRRFTVTDVNVVAELDARSASDVTVTLPGDCPVRVAKDDVARSGTIRRARVPWLAIGPDLPQAGFDAPVRITATPGCPEAAATHVSWKTVAGAELRSSGVESDGRVFFGRTAPIDALVAASDAWGIVPISPQTRSETVLEARFGCGNGALCRRTVHVSAAARSRGLPNVAVGTRMYLHGHGWHVTDAPSSVSASLVATDRYAAFTPGARGAFVLEDGSGRSLRITAGKYDETPLDCGKSGCHMDVVQASLSSPMATILERGLDAPFSGDYPACALACHATGEPGIDDGGFVAVSAALGRSTPTLAHGYDSLPASLRRLAGVGCLACHGPGAIPEESARFAILRSGVCATCHDAPPRYGHVAAWNASAMARADHDSRTRDAPCARCHTTWGFLDRPKAKPPDPAGGAGIGCAACHAVHDAQATTGGAHGVAPHANGAHSLLRAEPLPELLSELPASASASRVCLPCHTASPSEAVPAASEALLWAGRGGLDEHGAPLSANAPHVATPGGCLGCHRTSSADVEHGRSHGFGADTAACGACHAEKRPSPDVAKRAAALWARLGRAISASGPLHAARRGAATSVNSPLHADPAAAARLFERGASNTPLGAAAWDVALVLEDRGAAVHGGSYANQLLDTAERILNERERRTNGAAR
jgi:hypothetical protein